ncbi:MAG: tetratricopeptide repeat protein [Bryobacteraceae bacterium]
MGIQIALRSLLTLPLAVALAAQDPAIQSEFGKQALAGGRYEEAARIYADLAKRFPTEPGMLVNLGMAQHLSGDPKSAIVTFRAALKLNPNLPPAYLFLGSSQMQLGAPALAIAPLRKFLTFDGRHGDARAMLADALLATGKPRDAAAEYRAFTKVAPHDPRGWQGLGRANEAIATDAFTALEKQQAGSVWSLLLVAEAQFEQRQFSSSYYLFREALKKSARAPGAHEAIARIYRESGHADWAETEEKLGAGVKPLPPHLLYTRAKNAQKEAAAAYQRLVELPPRIEIHMFLAETFRQQKRHIEEIAQWEAALRFDPGNPSLLTELAIAKHYARDDAGAQAIVEKILPDAPDSPQLNFMLGDTLLSQQQAAKAVPYLEKAVALDPKVLAARSALARALIGAGRGAEAIPHLEAALPIDKDGSLHFQLGRAQQAAGNAAAAKETMASYQAIRAKMTAERRALEEEVQITAPPAP